MANVVAVVGIKGGVGKTTLAVHLADLLAEQGHAVGVADCDPQQASTKWLTDLRPDMPVDRPRDAQELLHGWSEMTRGKDWLVIDGPGNDSEITRAIMLRSHLVILPCGPSFLDARAIMLTQELLDPVQDIRGGLPQAVIAPTRWTATKVAREVKVEIDNSSGLLILPAIPQRAAIAEATAQGVTIWNTSHTEAADAMRTALLEAIAQYPHEAAAFNPTARPRIGYKPSAKFDQWGDPIDDEEEAHASS